jgi:hypothetical protein
MKEHQSEQWDFFDDGQASYRERDSFWLHMPGKKSNGEEVMMKVRIGI